MRAAGLIALLLVAASTPAFADGPIVVRVGIGLTVDRDVNRPDGTYVHHSPTTGYGPDLELDLAYRVLDFVAAGVHVGRTQHDMHLRSGNIPGQDMVFDGDQIPVELGVTLPCSYDRFWIAPWIGMVDVAGLVDQRMLGFGGSGGADVWVSPTGHRIGVFAEVSRASTDGFALSSGNLYLSAGIAYRYW